MFFEPFHIPIPFGGTLDIAPYGIMVAFGLLMAIVLGGRENLRIRLMTPELFEKVALWTVLWGLIFSRLFYVFTDLGRFMENPKSIVAIWEGGLVFYGGPIGAVLYLVYHYVLRKSGPLETNNPELLKEAWEKLKAFDLGAAASGLFRTVFPKGDPEQFTAVKTLNEAWQRLLRFFDLGAPMLALAHAFGRLGCLCAGCCYGAAHQGALSLHYPEGSPAFVEGGLGRYPIPLIESGIELMLFFWLMNLRLKKRFHGQVMLHYVIFYPAARFILEMFRGDAVRGYVMKLETPGINAALGLDPSIPVMMTTSQFISLFVVTAAIVLVFVGKRASADGPIPESAWWEDEDEDEDEDGEYEEDEDEDEDGEHEEGEDEEGEGEDEEGEDEDEEGEDEGDEDDDADET